MLTEIHNITRIKETEDQFILVIMSEGIFAGKSRLKNVYTGDLLPEVFNNTQAAIDYLEHKGWTLIE